MKRASDIPRMSKEVVLEAAKLKISDPEVRFLVSNYYASQEARKRADMQIRHLGDKEMPAVLQYTADANAVIEVNVKKALQAFVESKQIGRWMMAQDGVGPVISAGLLAHLTITHYDKVVDAHVPTTTVGHWYSFAGLDPDKKWERSKKRPWNADLKQIIYHLGECIKRVSNKETSFYGRIYRERKAMLVARNEAGYNAERAKSFGTNSAEVKKTLAQGKLPAGNLDRQACNYVAKIFLSNLHALWFWDHYDEPPPKPFAIAILGHADILPIPEAETFFPGFSAAYFRKGGKAQAA